MVKPSSSSVSDSAGDSLLADLLTINDEVDASVQEMEYLVRLPSLPDRSILSAVRLRFSRALRRHLQLVDDPVRSYLRTMSDAEKPGVAAYRQLLQRYHEAAAHHVARWPSTRVEDDWDGYRRSVEDMLALLRQRVAIERRDIHPLLTDGRSQ